MPQLWTGFQCSRQVGRQHGATESTGFEVRWRGGFWEGISLCIIAKHSTVLGYFLAYNSANLLNILLNMHSCPAAKANFWLFPP